MHTTTRRTALAGLAAAASVLATAALAQEPVTVKGMILSHGRDRLVLRTATGDLPVNLLPTTKIESTKGVLGLRRDDQTVSNLIPGLAIEATGMMRGSEFDANTVSFNPDDLKTAKQIQAGLHGTEERLSNVGDLVAVGRTSVFFAVGSSTISAKGKQDLQAIARQAKTHKGYRLAVVGRADPTGSVAANQRLSEARAAAVTAYLMQAGGVLPGSLLPASAVGESPVFQDPNPPRSDADARRVTVTIAVSKATVTAEQ